MNYIKKRILSFFVFIALANVQFLFGAQEIKKIKESESNLKNCKKDFLVETFGKYFIPTAGVFAIFNIFKYGGFLNFAFNIIPIISMVFDQQINNFFVEKYFSKENKKKEKKQKIDKQEENIYKLITDFEANYFKELNKINIENIDFITCQALIQSVNEIIKNENEKIPLKKEINLIKLKYNENFNNQNANFNLLFKATFNLNINNQQEFESIKKYMKSNKVCFLNKSVESLSDKECFFYNFFYIDIQNQINLIKKQILEKSYALKFFRTKSLIFFSLQFILTFYNLF